MSMKRSIYVNEEIYICQWRGLYMSLQRSIYVNVEVYICQCRGLYMSMKRSIYPLVASAYWHMFISQLLCSEKISFFILFFIDRFKLSNIICPKDNLFKLVLTILANWHISIERANYSCNNAYEDWLISLYIYFDEDTSTCRSVGNKLKNILVFFFFYYWRIWTVKPLYKLLKKCVRRTRISTHEDTCAHVSNFEDFID